MTYLWLEFLFLFLAIINFLTFFFFGFDKLQSTTPGARRISERTLWLLTLFGGSLGALLGMKIFRHKTKKSSFQGVVIVIVVVQILFVVLLISQFKPDVQIPFPTS